MRPIQPAWAALCAAVLLGGGSALADEPVRRVTFFFYGAPEGTSDPFLAERRSQAVRDFAKGGFVEGRNLSITLVNAGVDEARIEALAAEVVARRPDVICVPGNRGARLFQRLTREVPIVFFNVADAVGARLVASLRQPGANVTGVTSRYFELWGKRLELLKEIKPGMRRVADLMRPASWGPDRTSAIATAKGLEMTLVDVVVDFRIDEETVVQRLKQAGVEGVVVGVDAAMPRGPVMRYLEQSRIPAVFPDDGIVDDGGLLSLGSRWDSQATRAVDLATRILRGDAPANLPVDQLASPYLAINLGTAKAMGLAIPATILVRADRVVDQAAR